MKKVLAIIGMILCVFSLTSCISKIEKIWMKTSFDSGEGIEITNDEEIKTIQEMVMNQEFELFDINDIPDDYQIGNGMRIGITFQNWYNYCIGKTTCYYVSPAGYVSYGHLKDDDVMEGHIYISKNKIDYEWLYEKIINN